MQIPMMVLRSMKINKAKKDEEIAGVIQGWEKERIEEVKRQRKLSDDNATSTSETSSDDRERLAYGMKKKEKINPKVAVIKYLTKIREMEFDESDSSEEEVIRAREIKLGKRKNKFIFKLTHSDKTRLMILLKVIKNLEEMKFLVDQDKWRAYEKKYRRKWTYVDGKLKRIKYQEGDSDDDFTHSKTPAQDYYKKEQMLKEERAERSKKKTTQLDIAGGAFIFPQSKEERLMQEKSARDFDQDVLEKAVESKRVKDLIWFNKCEQDEVIEKLFDKKSKKLTIVSLNEISNELWKLMIHDIHLAPKPHVEKTYLNSRKDEFFDKIKEKIKLILDGFDTVELLIYLEDMNLAFDNARSDKIVVKPIEDISTFVKQTKDLYYGVCLDTDQLRNLSELYNSMRNAYENIKHSEDVMKFTKEYYKDIFHLKTVKDAIKEF